MKCVEFLRSNNVGVATFIGLDKVGVVVDQQWAVQNREIFILILRLST